VAADDHSPSNLRGQNERTEESRRKQPGPAAGRDCIPGERGSQFAAQSVVRSAEPTDKKPEQSLADDCPNKPPRVLPNTYWTRKGGGWVLEFKKKVKREWLYEYYGLLKMET
jgi:hypothetical protein